MCVVLRTRIFIKYLIVSHVTVVFRFVVFVCFLFSLIVSLYYVVDNSLSMYSYSYWLLHIANEIWLYLNI